MRDCPAFEVAEEVGFPVTAYDLPDLYFIMGPTCAGKSTFLHLARNVLGDKVELIEVGKMLRAKYPPEHFAGQNNPKHCAEEAWKLCEQGVLHARDRGKTIILVDGQPRDIPQVDLCFSQFPESEFNRHFVLIDCPIEEREARAREHRSGADLETLAIPRLTNDMIAYYSVLVRLLHHEAWVHTFDSSNPKRKPAENVFEPLLKVMRDREWTVGG